MENRMRRDEYKAAFAEWPPIFNQQFGYKQVLHTIKEEGAPVTIPLTGLHKNGWWIGVRVTAAHKDGNYDAAFTMRVCNEEWTQITDEWCQMEPVHTSASEALVICSESLPAGTTLSVRLCFHYTT